MIVGVDAGHGLGNVVWGRFDPGAVSAGVREADITLSIALLLRDECELRGWLPIMTRVDNETNAGLLWRVSKFRVARCDVIVSIHCNAHTTDQANGIETWFIGSPSLAANIQRRLVEDTGLRDRGIKTGNLAMLRYERPAALVEVGFITNPIERGRMQNPKFQASVAIAIADGIASTIEP